ncbi:putative exported alpha-N-acetylgalactosaminidase (plasmid) [Paraburkholderia caribensis MBA4]|uniref:Putative exported alpha-N-acetylgalactosaminidase n=1 Tax=Paraburkholderia caribensis MBA4 TaxID=1323664 RepID=A0A0P0RLS9_9BURK|nr:enterotoxin [Paraburkholderia caribensis]ALL69694.1 putative exported alpha-N-acetylgalactosaminidase [Paraburkholderia caribensis MBA4]
MHTGSPVFQAHDDHYAFGNGAIALHWTIADRSLCGVCVADRAHGRTLAIDAPFVLTFADGRTLDAASLRLVAPLREEALPANPDALRKAGRVAGKRVIATLGDSEQRLRVEWSVEQREDARYLRQHLSITALVQDEPIASISLLHARAPNASKAGDLAAVPVVDGNLYLGFELPMAESEVRDGVARLSVSRALPLEKGKTLAYSAVAGVFREGQLRRDFAAYVERERARPYGPFLHYNSWYDIGFLTTYTQAQAIERIHAVGHELHEKRGVQLDSFLFDDGWDDYSGNWSFSPAFPDGFQPLKDAAARYGAAPSVWLSPWGGYGPPRTERVTRGQAAGYETIGDGFALSGPKYYRRFHDVAMELLTRHGVNHFKLDGTGNANRVVPGSRFNSDWDAAVELIEAMRGVKHDVFVNLSTGTQASPFWLRHVDSIWRDGADYGFAGTGSDRERWITYRDAQTYRNVVCRSPLFPLNSLMLHGIIYAQENARLNTDPGDAFPHEVQSYFGSGTQLQELYVTPSLLDEHDWDVLALAARWARAHADVLGDSHWIGGAPDQLEIYGWAAWTPSKAIVTLRNPDDRANGFMLDLRTHLELPGDVEGPFRARFPFIDGDTDVPTLWDADRPQAIRLDPFQVLTIELSPVLAGGL